jgi:flagellar protein FliS
MRTTGYQTYLENEILSAGRVRLIQIMYTAALDAVAAARRSLRAGEIIARSRSITKAMRIVIELSRCLNREGGGELSENLAKVYSYVLRQLIEANAKQIEAPLAETERLLTTLAGAWNQCVLPDQAVQDGGIAYQPALTGGETQPVVW